VLAIGADAASLPGTPTRDPVFGLEAIWVPVELASQAELVNVTVVDRASVITTHLSEIVRANAGSLLGRQEVKALVDLVRQTSPVVADEMTSSGLSLGDVQRVLQALLDEGVSIRDLVRICEVLSERAPFTKDSEALTEAVRAEIGPAISAFYATGQNLQAMTLDPLLEQELVEAVRAGADGGTVMAMEPSRATALLQVIAGEFDRLEQLGGQPVLVCSAKLRASLHRLVCSAAPRLPVLGYTELGPQLTIEYVGVVGLEHAAAV
jgi:flagellar biosynthesis protein FlhA